MLQFGGTGWAFIQKFGSKPQWGLAELSPAVVRCSAEGAHYTHVPIQKVTTWHRAVFSSWSDVLPSITMG
eukprot:624635-Lingulodinium_polyedra.AAC.1